ncbi:MAG: ribosomal protein S18-alanine N-acetyltransferase [Synergistaceae bacterium]|nr:ribosomal protein S18-alanine N-acetyltransferase [Synergistaceae bacterium]
MLIADIDFCKPEDLEELYAIESACFKDPLNRRVMEHDLANLGQTVYLKAVVDCAIAGYGILARDGADAHVLNIAVMPEYRSNGIGLQLMFSFGEIAAEWGSKNMRLEVRKGNSHARHFYLALGFIYAKSIRNYYADGEDALIMTARLPLAVK